MTNSLIYSEKIRKDEGIAGTNKINKNQTDEL